MPAKGLKKVRKSAKPPIGPIKWDGIPHNKLWNEALVSLSPGSPERAAPDAVRSILRRRLERRDPVDHDRYIELECARIVETLRRVRDVYRSYLKPKVRGPLTELYWVILRFGVKDWAIVMLRATAITYAANCALRVGEWKPLFALEGPWAHIFRPRDEPLLPDAALLPMAELQKTITLLLPPASIDEIRTGGPFGRDGQIGLIKTFPGREFSMDEETFLEAMERRLSLWEESGPWVEGLSRLFDAAQEEVLHQMSLLQNEGHHAEMTLVEITALQRIAHQHLNNSRGSSPVMGATQDERWNLLLGKLDKAGVDLEQELTGKARDTLMALRKKGQKIRTWTESYQSRNAVTLEDGTQHTLRREICKFLSNAAKKAEYERAKIWSRSNTAPLKSRGKKK